MKRIIICTDGTWNEPETDENGYDISTNVFKLFSSVSDYDTNRQISQDKYYVTGVGTGGTWDKYFGGITGSGLNKKIIDAYTYLVLNYKPGDELYFFGFSRGAYTARSLVGLIRNSGIVKRYEDILPAFKLYRSRKLNNHPDFTEAISFRRLKSHTLLSNSEDQINDNGENGLINRNHRNKEHREKMHQDHVISVKFIGIWDTVGSLGIPGGIFQAYNRWRYRFHDITLTSTVDHAYHAIAVDERRKSFIPSIWEQSESIKYGTNKYVQQMWFPGVHSNIGGGYVETGLSDLTLQWMIRKAQYTGLHFDNPLNTNPNSHGVMVDSKNGDWKYRFSPDFIRPIILVNGRLMKEAMRTNNSRLNRSYNEYVHLSVEERLKCKDCSYDPENVEEASKNWLNELPTRMFVR